MRRRQGFEPDALPQTAPRGPAVTVDGDALQTNPEAAREALSQHTRAAALRIERDACSVLPMLYCLLDICLRGPYSDL